MGECAILHLGAQNDSDMGNCQVHFSPVDVHQRLNKLGLSKDHIDQTVQAGLLARRECTGNHPVTAAGFNQWSEMVRVYRDLLLPVGWELSNEANQGLICNPGNGICIAVVQGDKKTGRADSIPSTRSPRGPKTTAAVMSNNDFLFSEMAEDEIAALAESHRDFWLFMVHFNERAGRVQSELSRPIRMSEGKRPIAWSERIIFPDVVFSDPAPLPLPGPRTPEIVVEVKRRA